MDVPKNRGSKDNGGAAARPRKKGPDNRPRIRMEAQSFHDEFETNLDEAGPSRRRTNRDVSEELEEVPQIVDDDDEDGDYAPSNDKSSVPVPRNQRALEHIRRTRAQRATYGRKDKQPQLASEASVSDGSKDAAQPARPKRHRTGAGGVDVEDLEADRISSDEEPRTQMPPPTARPMVIDVTELPSDDSDEDQMDQTNNQQCYQELLRVRDEVSVAGFRKVALTDKHLCEQCATKAKCRPSEILSDSDLKHLAATLPESESATCCSPRITSH